MHVNPFIVDTVLRNLVSNANKFTPRGGYTSLTAYPAGEFIEVAVTDTGIGISPDWLGSLFAIDQRTSTAGTEGENGTGLGLHICQELVEAEGGTIWIGSTERRGHDLLLYASHAAEPVVQWRRPKPRRATPGSRPSLDALHDSF